MWYTFINVYTTYDLDITRRAYHLCWHTQTQPSFCPKVSPRGTRTLQRLAEMLERHRQGFGFAWTHWRLKANHWTSWQEQHLFLSKGTNELPTSSWAFEVLSLNKNCTRLGVAVGFAWSNKDLLLMSSGSACYAAATGKSQVGGSRYATLSSRNRFCQTFCQARSHPTPICLRRSSTSCDRRWLPGGTQKNIPDFVSLVEFPDFKTALLVVCRKPI